MLAAIGVLLMLAGVSSFLFGVVRHYFPSTNSLIPDELKIMLTMRAGVYSFLAGIVLLRFF